MAGLLFFAFWASSVDNEAGALHFVAIWKMHFWDREVFEAKGGAAAFAVEMYVHVVVDGMVVAVTEFIASAFAVFKNMDEVLLFENCQGAEDTRLVDAANVVFELAHREGTACFSQGLCHDNAVSCGADAVLLH